MKMTLRTLCVFGMFALFASASSSTHAASIKDVFEKYNLFGVWAFDCSKPARADNNWYFVNRPIDADHVQRDFMDGPTSRLYYVILDKAVETAVGEISFSGEISGKIGNATFDRKPTEGIWRIQGNRMQQREATVSGEKTITAGRLLATGKDIPWLNRCSAR